MAKEFVKYNGEKCYNFEPSKKLLNKNIRY
ncbi:hypothetical protein BDFB_011219 [Asbolus verrucosus]|uniref:Uncharacterized protein n=1 Tax=Asbolus verrucosus TaxID=1661398 RepID=A0A482VPH7_ASBVE|nr:hypothetical protein BDFB_011219 [Asbolus verrucosus]